MTPPLDRGGGLFHGIRIGKRRKNGKGVSTYVWEKEQDLEEVKYESTWSSRGREELRPYLNIQ